MGTKNQQFREWCRTHEIASTVRQLQIHDLLYQRSRSQNAKPAMEALDSRSVNWEQDITNAITLGRRLGRRRHTLSRRLAEALNTVLTGTEREPQLSKLTLASFTLNAEDIVHALQYTDQFVMNDALDIVALFRVSEAGPVLVRQLDSRAVDYAYKCRAAETIGTIRYLRGPSSLLRILRDVHCNNSINAGRTFGFLTLYCPKRSIVCSSSVELKYAAEHYIVSFGVTALPYLEHAKNGHSHVCVREEVCHVIEKIKFPGRLSLNEKKLKYLCSA